VAPLPGHHQQQRRRQPEEQDGRQPPIEDGFDGALDRRQPRLAQRQQRNVTPLAEAHAGGQHVVEAGRQMHLQPVGPGGRDQDEFPQRFPGQRLRGDDRIVHLQAAGRLHQ